MSTFRPEIHTLRAQQVRVEEDALVVELQDGRILSLPLAYFPRMLHGTSEERRNFRLIGNGEGIHWPDLDEDISIEHLLLGIPSGESAASLQRWLEKRQTR